MTTILGINGSPRIGGNTDLLLDKALAGAAEAGARTEKIMLNELLFRACQECEIMSDDGTCLVRDQLQPVYQKVFASQGIILASPIFFGSVSAQLKMLIDRYQCAWRAKYLLHKNPFKEPKYGAFISVEASQREDFFANARAVVRNFFAVIGADCRWELTAGGLEEKGSVLNHPELLQKAFEIGRELAAAAK